MLYFNYKVVYYVKHNGRAPVQEYLNGFSEKERAKIWTAINYLVKHEGKLDEPHTKHIIKKIWELRVKFENHYHRIFYTISQKREVVLLSAFIKKSQKTPRNEIEKASKYLFDYLIRTL